MIKQKRAERVYKAIRSLVESGQDAFGFRLLCEKAGLSVWKTALAVAELEQEGRIAIERNRIRQPNRYTICV